MTGSTREAAPPPAADPRPALSVVVVAHHMNRVLPRTLRSLSSSYQRGIDSRDYEVRVMDNGMADRVDDAMVRSFGPRFFCDRVEPARPSPAIAANAGIALSRGDVVGMMLDGARLASPGLLASAMLAMRLSERAVVATLGWHLGRKPQFFSVKRGFDAKAEQRLLESVRWPEDGYRLFEIACLGGSYRAGWFGPIFESSALFLRRSLWNELSGFDVRFDEPGGGLLNLDLYRRACEAPGILLVVLLGEGTFHQLHGGVASERPWRDLLKKWSEWNAQYERLTGRPFEPPKIRPVLFGRAHPAVLPLLDRSLRPAARRARRGEDPWTG